MQQEGEPSEPWEAQSPTPAWMTSESLQASAATRSCLLRRSKKHQHQHLSKGEASLSRPLQMTHPNLRQKVVLVQPWPFWSMSWSSNTKAQLSSAAQSCPTLCRPTDCSAPGFPVHHQLLEFTQTPVCQVSDALQPSHPLSSPPPPTFSLSQHQGLFK